MDRISRFAAMTVQFYAPDIEAGTEFYTRLLKRPPNFAPTPDFREWDDVVPNVTFQLGQGEPIPTYPIRLRVDDIEAERERVRRELDPPFLSDITWIAGLVALCDLRDPWGNAIGFFQVLFTGEPPTLSGTRLDTATELERLLEREARARTR